MNQYAGALAVEQPGGRGYPLKSMLREPTNPLNRMPRIHRAVRCCSLRYSAALFGYVGVSAARGPAAELVVELPAAELRSPRVGLT